MPILLNNSSPICYHDIVPIGLFAHVTTKTKVHTTPPLGVIKEANHLHSHAYPSLMVKEHIRDFYVYDNYIKDTDAQLLFRLSDCDMAKLNIDNIPDRAKAILPN